MTYEKITTKSYTDHVKTIYFKCPPKCGNIRQNNELGLKATCKDMSWSQHTFMLLPPL